MSVVWGDFESMAVHYLKQLPKMKKGPLVFFYDMTLNTYGVCDVPELASMMNEKGIGKIRPICCMLEDEFIGLLIARYRDFFKEEADGAKEKDISAGEQSGDQSAALDAGGDQSSEGGRGKDNGGQQEEDNNRTVH